MSSTTMMDGVKCRSPSGLSKEHSSSSMMRMKRRRLPFERLRVVVTQEHTASASTEGFCRLWFNVGSWTALVLLLTSLSFSFTRRHVEDLAAFPKRTKGHDSALLVKTSSIRQEAAAASSHFFNHSLVASDFDAFALMSQLQTLGPSIEDASSAQPTDQLLKTRAQDLMSEFAQKYGGQGQDGIMVARSLLSGAFDSVVTSSSLDHTTTNRTAHHLSIVQKVAQHVPNWLSTTVTHASSVQSSIRILFVGGTAAAGVGNYRGQAYSAVMERLLTRLIVRDDAEQEPFIVYHASVPDEEEFPLVWCFLSQFDDENLPTWIVWDFPQDDATASSTTKLEIFLRMVVTRWRAAPESRPPLMIFRSMNARGRSLLRYYQNSLPDVLLLDSSVAAEPMLVTAAGSRPPGFADWSIFSGRPTDTNALLSVQHHEWIGWLLTMQLLAGLLFNSVLPEATLGSDSKSQDLGGQSPFKPLPTPKYVPTDRVWSSLILGEHAVDLKCYSSLMMSPYTANGNKLEASPGSEDNEGNFALLPVMSTNRTREPNHLNHLVIGGAVTTRMENILLPHTSFYSQGWVLDLDLASKRAKQRTAPDFLGFEDWKTAYYGTATSPPLALSLPTATQRLWLCESSSTSDHVDENDGCSLHRDVAFRVNGVPVDRVTEVEVVTAFEKRPCVEVPLPENRDRSDVYMELTLQVAGSKMPHQRAPCSLAHVLYV